jgi:hypothetical protein
VLKSFERDRKPSPNKRLFREYVGVSSFSQIEIELLYSTQHKRIKSFWLTPFLVLTLEIKTNSVYIYLVPKRSIYDKCLRRLNVEKTRSYIAWGSIYRFYFD